MAGAGCMVPHSAAEQEREDVVDDDDDDEDSEAEGEESEKDSEVEQGEVEQSEVEQISQSEWEDDKVDGPAEEHDQAADFGNYFEEGGSEPTENEDALSSYVPEEPESLPGLTPDDELERSAEVAAYQDECAPDPSPSPLELCVICGDVISSTLIRLDCAHAMDPACLRAMFENAISAKALFEPPRCCHIPVELSAVGEHLYPGLVDLFEEKMREFRVPVGERVYCHSCSSFLGPHTVFTATLYCSECTHTTCSSCREWAHPGEACQEAGEGPVLDLAKAQGWQRCVSCKHLVERRDGCPHMQCICRAQFCYLCGREWGKCNSTCPR
ncbi:hypothetical protein BC628DRAFT_1379988 [Trametes gibbosa]|nr:hypothetical protein BC628DRAFT_1379988 [Trametes gibbosa]